MRFVPKINVRGQLTLTILLAILISWGCCTGISNYLTYRQLYTYRAVMLANPDQYPNPIPQPVFGLREFLLGYPPRLPHALHAPLPRRPRTAPPPLSPAQAGQQRTTASATVLIVLGIALLAGGWSAAGLPGRSRRCCKVPGR